MWLGVILYKELTNNENDNYPKPIEKYEYKIYFSEKNKLDWQLWPGNFNSVQEASEAISKISEKYNDFDFCLARERYII